MNNNFLESSALLTIQEAAQILGVSTKTLRRWDKAGILVPNRTVGNQRRYLREKIEVFTRSKTLLYSPSQAPQVQEPLNTERFGRFLPKANPIQIAVVASAACIFLILLGIHIGANVLLKSDIGKANLESTLKGIRKQIDQYGENIGKGLVLGEATPKNEVLFNINASSSFNNSAVFLEGIMAAKIATLSGGIITEDQDIDAGTGTLTASNVLYGATAGTGISIGTGQRPTLTNTDLGSSQNIFKTIKVGSDSFSTGSNTDTLEFSAGTGISLSADKSNKKVTITGSATSGWTDDGTPVRLTTSTDSVGIGLTSPSSKLDVLATTEQLRLLYDSSNYTSFTISSDGDLTLNPTGGDIILADADVLNIGGSGSDTAYNIIGDSSSGASSVVDSDDDLYIEGNIEVDGTVRLNNVSYTFPSADGSNTNVLTTNGSGTLSWASSGGGSNWSISSGAISPINSTLDLLIGNSASSSAKFAVLNVSSGTPTASASAGVAGGAYLTATGTLSTTAMQTLTLGGSTTGNITIDSGTSSITLSDDTTVSGDLAVNGATSADITSTTTTGTLFNTTVTTLSLGGAATTLSIGASTGTTTVNNALTVTGAGTFNNTFTNTNGTTSNSLINLTSSGDFVLQDAGVTVFTFTDAGILTLASQAPTEGSNFVALTNTAGSGTSYDMLDISLTSASDDAGADTQRAAALTITGPTDTEDTTVGLAIVGGTASGGTEVAVDIPAITAGAGTETAIRIGSGWDTVLDSNALDISGAGVVTGATGITSSGTITLSGLTASRAVFTDASSNLTTTAASSALSASLSDETGTGVAVFGTAPTFTTSISLTGDIITGANTAAALDITDGTTAYGTLDTRTGTSGVSAWTLTAAAQSFASAAGAEYTTLTVTPPTITLTGTTGVTTQMDSILINAPTITDVSTVTVTQASTLTIAGAPSAGGSVTITNALALAVNAGNAYFAGRVGINTLPNLLTTQSGGFLTIAAGGSGAPPAIRIENSNGYEIFGASASSFDTIADANITFGIDGNSNSTTDQFIVYTNNASTELFEINENGNVGILDTTPDALLNIQATGAANDGIIIEQTNAGDYDPFIDFQLTDGTTLFRLGVDDSDNDTFKIGTTALETSTMLTLDSRTTTSGVSTITLAGIAPTIATGAGTEEYTTLTVTPPTITLTGGTQVTSQMDSILISQPTITDTTAITVDDAATLTIAGAAISGSAGSVTISDSYALKINTTSVDAGTGTVTRAYGLYLDAPTGAGTNYAAVFATGNVGIGTTSPASLLTLGNSVTTNGILRLAGFSSPSPQIIIADSATGSSPNITGGSRLTLTSSGSAPDPGGGNLALNGGGAIIFGIVGTEEMRILDNAVGIGDTGPDAFLDIRASGAADNGIIIEQTNAGDYDPIIRYQLVDGTTLFTVGVDDSVTGDPFKISTTALGTGDTLTIDSRTTTSDVSAITLAGIAASPPEGASAEYTTLTVTPPTITLTGATGVTSVMDSILINAPTITDTTAVTIDKAATFTIGGNPTAGGSVTITAPRALNVDGRVEINLAGTQTSVALCGSHAAAGGASVSDVEIVDCTGTPGADYMEMYPTGQDVEPGDLVMPGSDYTTTKNGERLATLIKTASPYQRAMIGIVSDPSKAGDFNSIGYDIKDEDNPMPIALNGRVQVKVSLENGAIAVGDYLTSSSISGVAMKATKPGYVVGMALEGFDSGGEDGKILVFINLHWQDPSIYIAADGNLSIEPQAASLLAFSSTDTASASAQTKFDLARDPTFQDLQNKVDLLEDKIDFLSLMVNNASTSALLSVILASDEGARPESPTTMRDSGVAPIKSGLPRMTELETATISGTLMVLGRTTVTDLGITGNINTGLLSISGLDPLVNGATINTLSGNLYLQNESLGGIDILNGEIVIDKDGTLNVKEKITAKTVEAEEFAVKGGKSIGTGAIEANAKFVEIATPAATANSKIFITPTTPTSRQLAVTYKADGKFRVEVIDADTVPISFDWWVVGAN